MLSSSAGDASVSSLNFLKSRGFVEHSTVWSPAERAFVKELQQRIPGEYTQMALLLAAASEHQHAQGGAKSKVLASAVCITCAIACVVKIVVARVHSGVAHWQEAAHSNQGVL